MTEKLKIGLLCNNVMALPAMQRIAASGLLCFTASADTNAEATRQIRDAASKLQVRHQLLDIKNREQQLKELLTTVQPDIVFVMTWPWRITAASLQIPKYGFLNFHYGLLPEMRGADPIFESIRQRKATAGATVHKMDAEFDCGPVVLREEIPLPAEFTYGILSGQMAVLGDKMCAHVIADLQQGNELSAIPQNEALAAYWPKVGLAELAIKWDKMTQAEIAALVRACNPVMKGLPVMINNWSVGIADVTEVNLQGDASAIQPGTILALDPQNGLIVCCRDGKALRLDVVYTAEGAFPGFKLGNFGIRPGMIFTSVC